jgi:hypothetical protein
VLLQIFETRALQGRIIIGCECVDANDVLAAGE